MMEEAAVIGCLMRRPAAIHELDFLKASMFTDEIYRAIYEQYEKMADEEPDGVLIQSAVSERYPVDIVRKAMIEANRAEIFSGNARKHAKKVYDAYRIGVIENMVAMFQPTVETADADITRLMDEVGSLANVTEDGGKTLSEIADEVKDRYFCEKERAALNFGIEEIDDACGGMDGGDLVIIAARPAVGKSAFVLQAMRKFSAQGRSVAYFNLEMMQDQVYERAVASASGLELNVIRKNTRFHGNEQAAYEDGVNDLLKETRITVYQGAWSVAKIRAAQARRQFDVIVVDYLQLLSPDGKRAGNRTAEVGDISRGLKTIATDYGVPVIALSQLNRASETAKDKEPGMSELRESGAIEQDASIVLMLWQPGDGSERGVKIEKARQGRRVKINTNFDGRHMMFDCFGDTGFRYVTEETPFD